ncbi:hypothetical protein [Bacillus subtilis]|uniref:hypothetical protein n=1 Tax=Bacillus subtilis TaxID=1423 RepID=UPI00059BE01E|nr:hypothetical protein [Bacillus subtilis]
MALYIMLQDYDFSWKSKEIEAVKMQWAEGVPINEIAASIKRPIKEVFLLIYDLLDNGQIEKREGSIYGMAKSG